MPERHDQHALQRAVSQWLAAAFAYAAAVWHVSAPDNITRALRSDWLRCGLSCAACLVAPSREKVLMRGRSAVNTPPNVSSHLPLTKRLPRSLRGIPSAWRAVGRWFRLNTFAPPWLPRPLRRAWLAYFGAITAIVTATLLTMLLHWLMPTFAFAGVLSYLAVLLIALVWGSGPGLCATFVGVALLEVTILSLRHVRNLSSAANGVELLLFLLVGVTIALVSGQTQRARRIARTRAEADARRALLQLVVDEMPSGVFLVHGRDLRLVLANRAAREMLGAPWRKGQAMCEFLEVSGIHHLGLDGTQLPPDHLVPALTVSCGESVHHEQEIIRYRDGSSLPVLVNSVVLDPNVLGPLSAAASAPAVNGEEPVALVVLQDVSALKEAERLKDEFTAMAAHELRNPIAVLRGYSQLLLRQAECGKGGTSGWPLDAIRAMDLATTRLVELTDDLLDVTRLQAGRLQLAHEPVDIASLVRRVVARQQVTTSRHTLTVQAQPGAVFMLADPRRLEQVLTNLVGNAIKYSPGGGPVEIALDTGAGASLIEITVRDHGIGIPVEQQARIFGRFARADNARERGIQGTGLGLYLCRELVERHGGRIWFDSSVGSGSTFHVVLPLESGAVPDASATILGEQQTTAN